MPQPNMAPQTFHCDRFDVKTGTQCTHFSKRRPNLIRHIERKHKERLNDGFIQYVVNDHGILQKATPGLSQAANLTISEPVTSGVTVQAEVSSGSDVESVVQQAQTRNSDTNNRSVTSSTTFSPRVPSAPSPPSILTATTSVLVFPQILQRSDSPVPDLGLGSLLQPAEVHATEGSIPLPPVDNPVENDAESVRNYARATHQTPSWRQRKEQTQKRLRESFEKEDLPVYQVKRSRKWPYQQRAIAWLTYAAKTHFDCHFATILAQWGVREKHTSTCVLLPADWSALDPIRLATLFNPENCPRAWAEGMVRYLLSLHFAKLVAEISQNYQYDDHSTGLTRAAAWFADTDWPRNGSELDNLLGSGPHKQKQGSHLCHHHLCGIHLIFESDRENESRKDCHLRAKFLRQEGLPIPHYCTKHIRPCLMQHTALTTLEVFLLQFFVLCKAKGLAPLLTPSRPRWHTFPTFEYQLPLTFCQDSAVHWSEEMASNVTDLNCIRKPELRCPFCSGIKAFKSIIALWSHFVHQHYKSESSAWIKVVVEENLLLEEVRRTASLWRTYWREHSDGGKRRDPTMMKLLQVDDVNFTWVDVLEWKLR
jgi:hypothetical protein